MVSKKEKYENLVEKPSMWLKKLNLNKDLYSQENFVLISAHTPKVLQDIGFKDAPLVLSTDHLNTMTADAVDEEHMRPDPHLHHIKDEDMSKLTDILTNTAFACEDIENDYGVFCVSPNTQQGTQHHFAFAVQPYTEVNVLDPKAMVTQKLTANVIKTGFGMDAENLSKKIADAVRADRVVYQNNRGIHQLLNSGESLTNQPNNNQNRLIKSLSVSTNITDQSKNVQNVYKRGQPLRQDTLYSITKKEHKKQERVNINSYKPYKYNNYHNNNNNNKYHHHYRH